MTETAAGLLADVRELATGIAPRAAEIEAGRRIPLDLVESVSDGRQQSLVTPGRRSSPGRD